jgi:hypothetical protein
MRKWLFLAILIFALPLDSAAQIIPHFAVFGGYTYAHNKYTSSNAGFGLNGWDTSLEVKPLPFISVVGDLSNQYGSPNGIRENQTTFMVGPQLSVPGIKGVIPFAHALGGLAHGTNRVTSLGVLCVPNVPCTSAVISTGTGFATAVGGGVDLKWKGPIWVRAVQIDWVHANLSPDHHAQFRLATCIVFRFGK